MPREIVDVPEDIARINENVFSLLYGVGEKLSKQIARSLHYVAVPPVGNKISPNLTYQSVDFSMEAIFRIEIRTRMEETRVILAQYKLQIINSEQIV